MNLTDLAAHVASNQNISKTAANAALKHAFETIGNTLAEGEDVSIAGFGKFEARARAARTGRNPATGEAVEIAAKVVPAFKAAAALKRLVNGE